MRRWSALVEIVRSFNERGSPLLAFATVAVSHGTGLSSPGSTKGQSE